MKIAVCLFVLVGAVSAGVSYIELIHDEWQNFKLEHNKEYKSHMEEKFRMKIYLENKHKIHAHNKDYHAGRKTFKLKMNEFGDYLHHEFVATMNGFLGRANSTAKHLGATFIPPANVKVPDRVDWRDKGAVTPVKNQGQCGSCWSFSATGSLEGQHFRRTGKLVSLSEQNLIDCSVKYGNQGCNGGLMDQAFQYVKDNKGIDTETSYPYEGVDDKCRFNAKSVGAVDKGFVDIPKDDEDALKQAVASVGPVSVAIDASHESFQFYHEGVYIEPECSEERLDHGVLCVGYGTDKDQNQDYWLIKNSWGTTWGDQGYVKMARNLKNQCGVASSASYPLE